MLFNSSNSASAHSEADVSEERGSGGILPDSRVPKGRVVTGLLPALSILATQRSAHGSRRQPHLGARDKRSLCLPSLETASCLYKDQILFIIYHCDINQYL